MQEVILDDHNRFLLVLNLMNEMLISWGKDLYKNALFMHAWNFNSIGVFFRKRMTEETVAL